MLKKLWQAVVMAAIVATLAYLPAGLVLVLAGAALGYSFDALLTFGGALHELPGLVVWWLFVFVPACAYVVWLFPWADEVLAWPERK